MIIRRLSAGLTLVTVLILAALSTQAAAAQPGALPQTGSSPASLVPLRGNLYRVQAGSESGVLLVTPDGILLVDPLGTAVAHWLKAEVAVRFPGRAIRHVVHTDHRPARAGGAMVFRDTAVRVAHAAFNSELEARRASGGYDDVASVDLVYRRSHVITLGGIRVELLHIGDAAVPERTAVYFPSERTMFASYPPLTAPMDSWGPVEPSELLRRVQTIGRADVDQLVSNRGETNRIGELQPLRGYLERVLETARGARLARRALSAQELAAAPVAQGVWRTHLDSAFAATRVRSLELMGLGFANYVQRGDLCGNYSAPCQGAGGTALRVGGGLRYLHGRFGAVAEVLPGHSVTGYAQTFPSSILPPNREQTHFEHRETAVGVLFRYEFKPDRSFTLGVLAGPAVLVSEGIRRRVPADGRPPGVAPVVRQSNQIGLALGVEPTWYVGRRVGVVAPVRLIRANRSTPLTGVGSFSVHAGLGLVVAVRRGIS